MGVEQANNTNLARENPSDSASGKFSNLSGGSDVLRAESACVGFGSNRSLAVPVFYSWEALPFSVNRSTMYVQGSHGATRAESCIYR